MDTYNKIFAHGLRESGRKFFRNTDNILYTFKGYAIYRNLANSKRSIKAIYRFDQLPSEDYHNIKKIAQEDAQKMARPYELEVDLWGEEKVTPHDVALSQYINDNNLTYQNADEFKEIERQFKDSPKYMRYYKEGEIIFNQEIKENSENLPASGKNLALKATESDYLADLEYYKRNDIISQWLKDEPRMNPMNTGSKPKIEGHAKSVNELVKELIDNKVGFKNIITFLRNERGMSKRQAETTLSQAKRL